jgi:hypothetical protein
VSICFLFLKWVQKRQQPHKEHKREMREVERIGKKSECKMDEGSWDGRRPSGKRRHAGTHHTHTHTCGELPRSVFSLSQSQNVFLQGEGRSRGFSQEGWGDLGKKSNMNEKITTICVCVVRRVSLFVRRWA